MKVACPECGEEQDVPKDALQVSCWECMAVITL